MQGWISGAVLMGLIMLYPWYAQHAQRPLKATESAGGAWESMDYAQYRNQALKAAAADISINNRVLTDAEVGTTSMCGAVARMAGGILYVYAPLNSKCLARAKSLLGGTCAIGVNNNGVFENGKGAGVLLPAWIPDGAIVSVTQIR